MTPAQCRMARAALNLGVRELAEVAKMSTNTIIRLEAGEELKPRTVEAVRRVLEIAGVEFINGTGVNLEASAPAKTGGPGLNPDDPLFAFAQKLMDTGIGIIAGARAEIGQEWARDPRVVALTLLSRTLANLKGAVLTIREGLVVEARTLTRSACENFICVGGLAALGSAFVQDLVEDEAASRRRRGNFIVAESNGIDIGDTANKLSRYLKELEGKHPKPRKINLRAVADASAVRGAYLHFLQLSADAAHVSATSLNRHLAREHEGDTVYLRVDVAPDPAEAELRQTLEWLCFLVLGVCVGTNEILGGTPIGMMLRSLAIEFDGLKTEDQSPAKPQHAP